MKWNEVERGLLVRPIRLFFFVRRSTHFFFWFFSARMHCEFD